jgi:hypothetical protein
MRDYKPIIHFIADNITAFPLVTGVESSGCETVGDNFLTGINYIERLIGRGFGAEYLANAVSKIAIEKGNSGVQASCISYSREWSLTISTTYFS